MTEQATTTLATDTISEEQVVAYLRANSEFFISHEYLLKELKLPHASGKAISLGERQVQVFREHRDALQGQLNELVAVARENDTHFETSKRLLLSLLDVKGLDEVELVVQEAFKNDANIDFSSVIVFGDQNDYPAADLNIVSLPNAKDSLGNLVDATSAVCGRLKAEQREILFGNNADQVGSAAVIPIRHGELLGLFCLASKDEAHFDSSMGSLFLSYISDFISRLLPDLLLRSRGQQITDAVPSLLE